MAKMHNRILELKQRAKPIEYAVPTGLVMPVSIRKATDGLLEKRQIEGYAFVWGARNMHGEKMIKGCCAKSIQERGPASDSKYKITFMAFHKYDEPLSLFEVLEEDEYGLYFRTVPLDDVPTADRVLKQIRSGTLNQFSGGFMYVWDKMEYDEATDSIICKEIDLQEISVVTRGSDSETYALRNAPEALEELTDDTEDFIKQLPRKLQLQARQLIARHKSLATLEEPLEGRKPDTALEQRAGEPTPVAAKGKPDINYILNNLKFNEK